MPGRNFLFVPGPTNVPERVLRAMDRAMEDHRSSAFPELASGVLRDLKQVFMTATGQALIFPATGTGGWEAARPRRRERSEEHTSELQSRLHLVCRLLLEKKKISKRNRGR